MGQRPSGTLLFRWRASLGQMPSEPARTATTICFNIKELERFARFRMHATRFNFSILPHPTSEICFFYQWVGAQFDCIQHIDFSALFENREPLGFFCPLREGSLA
jgi:hypothetical protein